MKQKIISFFAVAFILLSVFSFGNQPYAKADEQIVRGRYETEISVYASELPRINVGEGKKYTIDLFAIDDIDYANPLATAVKNYKFSNIGEYKLRYNVTDEATSQVISYYSTLEVVDTTAPEIQLEYYLPTQVKVGDTVLFPDAVVLDNSGKEDIKYTVSVKVNNKDKSSSLTNRQLKITDVGEMVVTYSATDASGNVGSSVYKINCIASSAATESESKGCKSQILTADFGCLLLAVFIAVTVIRRKQSV